MVTASSGNEGIALVISASPSLVLLDMELADSQGLAVFRQIAAMSAVPVIMVTSGDDELDAVLALEAGAADHVTKPPRPRELTARIRAVLRRVGRQPSPPTPAPAGIFSMGPVCIDVSLREAMVRGRAVDLSRKEFDLLTLLISESGHVVTRQQCMEQDLARPKDGRQSYPRHPCQAAAEEDRDQPGRTPARPHRPRDRLPLQAVGVYPTPPWPLSSPHWSMVWWRVGPYGLRHVPATAARWRAVPDGHVATVVDWPRRWGSP